METKYRSCIIQYEVTVTNLNFAGKGSSPDESETEKHNIGYQEQVA